MHKNIKKMGSDPAQAMLSDGVWSHIWNGENRIISSTNSTNTAKLEYVYDYMGRRVSKKCYSWVNNAWQLDKYLKFVYDGYKQIAEYDGTAGTMQKNYTWQPGSVGQDVPLWLIISGNAYYYAVDGNKNIRAMVDGTGALVAEYEYGQFGEILSKYGTLADINPFRFSSEYFDAETGLIYYNYRYYSPDFRKWLSRDPIGEKGGYNLYCFVKNSPISKYDLLGAIAEKSILTEAQCECAYENAYAIFDDFRRKNPPHQPLNPVDGWVSFFIDRQDCNWGATEIAARLAGNSNVMRAFGLSVARGGKFSTFSFFPPLYSEIDKALYRFVRMHSVTALKPQNGCEKYYTETVFDYMNGLAYGLSEFRNEYNLDVTYEYAGYYAVENNNTNVLRPGQKSPKSVSDLIAEQ